MQTKIHKFKASTCKESGHTLVEVMVVIGIFLILFSTLATILLRSERTWQTGQNKLIEVQQARRLTDKLVGTIRESNPDWVVAGVHYPVTISNGNTRIDYYEPVFNSTGSVVSLKKVTFKVDPADSTRILMKEGTSPESIVATAVDSININCGCSGCTAVDSSCPRVSVNVVTRKNAPFNWTSQVTLRNTNMAVDDDVTVEEPAAGEF